MMKLDQPNILNELASATNDIARGEIIQLNLFENYLHLDLQGLVKSKLSQNWETIRGCCKNWGNAC